MKTNLKTKSNRTPGVRPVQIHRTGEPEYDTKMVQKRAESVTGVLSNILKEHHPPAGGGRSGSSGVVRNPR